MLEVYQGKPNVEKHSNGLERKTSKFSFYRNCTAQKKNETCGKTNEAIKHS